ncbi:MAG: hypothetical protein ACI4PV_03155 [Butyricicoccus sp.]
MKTYEKPRLAAISLAGNEQLCGNCDPGFISWAEENQMLIEDIVGDFGNLFNSIDSCSNIGDLQSSLDAYCKFTSVDGAEKAFMS